MYIHFKCDICYFVIFLCMIKMFIMLARDLTKNIKDNSNVLNSLTSLL